MSTFSRRRFLGGLASAALATTVSGCGHLVRPIVGFCPTDPLITDPRLPLTIDAHAHVFNGSDLQVNAFFSKIVVRKKPQLKRLGEILQDVAWRLAPKAGKEISELRRISGGLPNCTSIEGRWATDRENGYQVAQAELKRALKKRLTINRRMDRSSLITESIITQLPSTYSEYYAQRQQRLLATRDLSIVGGIDFVIRNFQYRYVNVFDYLRQYSTGSRHKVDLIVAHLVDYDWPIAMGKPTHTRFEEQVEVMEKISILTGGRIHCFAPFDPMKQVARELGVPGQSPMDFVQDAVDNRGFIGVKICPPMGFVPYGNARLPANTWDQEWIHPLLRRTPNLGRLMDEALLKLYRWCRTKGVPIMAHTAQSNGPSDAFELFTVPSYWQRRRDFPRGLRVNFGHFGNTDDVGSPRTAEFANLMTSAHGSNGEFFYADSSYFSEILQKPNQLKEELRGLYYTTSHSNYGIAPLAQRLMYGTDWEMIIIEGRETRNYLATFEKIFHDLDRDPSLGADGVLSERFFGKNAADFLGLRQGNWNRSRLDKFYERHKVPTPGWMAKVDNLPTV